MERKFPGDFAAGFIFRIPHGGLLEVLVVGALPIELAHADPYKQMAALQVKLPGGCAQNAEENADLRLALDRELRYELGSAGSENGLRIGVGEQIFARSKRSLRSSKRSHLQTFWMVEVDGEIRTEPKTEDEEDEILVAPMFSEVRCLMNTIFPTHREPLIRGIECVVRGNPIVGFEYTDVLSKWHMGELDTWALKRQH